MDARQLWRPHELDTGNAADALEESGFQVGNRIRWVDEETEEEHVGVVTLLYYDQGTARWFAHVVSRRAGGDVEFEVDTSVAWRLDV
jgi:hypothetical protein